MYFTRIKQANFFKLRPLARYPVEPADDKTYRNTFLTG